METREKPSDVIDEFSNVHESSAVHPPVNEAMSSRRMLAASLGSTLVAACGGGGSSPSSQQPSGGGTGSAPSPTPTPTPTSTSGPGSAGWAEQAYAARFLLRAQFSASPAEIADVRKEGAEAWLSRYMRQQNDQTATEFLTSNQYDVVDANRYFAVENIVDPMIWSQLFRGNNNVRKRISLALSEFFVVSANKLDIIWPSHAVAHYWDLLNEHAFGNFRQLLEAVALSPAMGAFLDSVGNRPDDPATSRKPDENFAREVMQLFTIGLQELNIDGSLRTSFGMPIETYSNDDVTGLARVFTGFNLDASNLEFFPDPSGTSRRIPHPDIVRRPMTANHLHWERPGRASEHSQLEKRFLGISIAPGTDATTSLRMALDRLFNHQNVGPFFGKQMIQRLVTSNPSPDYIARVASVFNNNGSGVRGDLAAVFRAILLDPEANHPDSLNDLRFGKLREPAVRFAQIARTSGMTQSAGKWISRDLSDPASLLGQVPLRAPSVFNFFRPQYVLPASVAAANGMVSPEFQLVNETSIAGYLNFLPLMIAGGATWMNDLKPEFRHELTLVEKPQDLLDHLDLVLTAGQLRPATRNTILPAIQSVAITPGDDAARLRRIHVAVALIMCSHDYLIQK